MLVTLRIGILGAAAVAPPALLAPASRRDDVVVSVVASRSPERAREFAAVHGIPAVARSYDDLLERDDLDLVYVALPPSEHARWSIAALEAGHHVLCEKPLATNAADAERMTAVAHRVGRRLIEALHFPYHPLWTRILELTVGLGELRRVEGDFLVNNPYRADSIRHERSLGGGALLDLGCYPLYAIRALLGQRPAVVTAHGMLGEGGADHALEAELLADSGVTAHVRVDMSHDFVNELRVIGERGHLTVMNPVFPTRGHRIASTIDGVPRIETVGGQETYDHQLAALVDALRNGGGLLTEGDDATESMRLIDDIYRRSGILPD